MIGITSALISCLAIAAHASPAALPQRRGRGNIQMPQSALPAPGADKEIRYVALGLGTQNYTCANNSPDTKPVAIGALAELYDITRELEENPGRTMSLPGEVLDRGLEACRGCRPYGDHFFDGPSPVFDFNEARPDAKIVVKKASPNVPAPADAHPGLTQEGAVDWLHLVDNQAGQTYGGIDTVYRVVTAGGKAPANCANVDVNTVITVKYATEYFAWGPRGGRGRGRRPRQ